MAVPNYLIDWKATLLGWVNREIAACEKEEASLIEEDDDDPHTNVLLYRLDGRKRALMDVKKQIE